MLGLLGRMSAGGPVLHVVEDVHWADRSTLDLLAFLATNLTDERVLVLLTYREDVRDESRTLGPWLAELGRLTTQRIQVPRLDRADAARLVTELAGAAAAARATRGDARALCGQPAVRRAAASWPRATTGARCRRRSTSCSGPASTTSRARPAACSVPPP